VAGLFEHNFGDSEVVMVAYAVMVLPFVVERSLGPGSPPHLDPLPHRGRGWGEGGEDRR